MGVQALLAVDQVPRVAAVNRLLPRSLKVSGPSWMLVRTMHMLWRTHVLRMSSAVCHRLEQG